MSFLWGEPERPSCDGFPLVTDDKPKEQLQRSLPRGAGTGRSDGCAHGSEAAETWSSPPEMGSVSAFFSLAALAEVAAMENVHRSVRTASSPRALGLRFSVPLHAAWMGKRGVGLSATTCARAHSALGFGRPGSRAPLLM